jgi:hypothetical protein
MARPIRYRSASPFTAEQTFLVMADPDYLRARLAKLGGPGAALLEHSVDGDGVRYRLRQGLDHAVLPPLVQSLVGDDLVIERDETVHPHPAGYRGDVGVRVPGTPVSASGAMGLRDLPEGSEFMVRAEVVVRVPIMGGKLETMIAEQVLRLLAVETEFTRDWLTARQG